MELKEDMKQYTSEQMETVVNNQRVIAEAFGFSKQEILHQELLHGIIFDHWISFQDPVVQKFKIEAETPEEFRLRIRKIVPDSQTYDSTLDPENFFIKGRMLWKVISKGNTEESAVLYGDLLKMKNRLIAAGYNRKNT